MPRAPAIKDPWGSTDCGIRNHKNQPSGFRSYVQPNTRQWRSRGRERSRDHAGRGDDCASRKMTAFCVTAPANRRWSVACSRLCWQQATSERWRRHCTLKGGPCEKTDSQGGILRKNKIRAIVIKSFALLVVLGTAHQAKAQDATTPYPKMAPIDQYRMPDREAEIALARSAAPESVSRDATILVLGRQGYETAVEGKNGFVCIVDRAWMMPFGWPEFWNPKVRAAVCLNPEAARSILPIEYLRAKMVMAGRSKAEIVSALKPAFENKQLPNLESGAMAYMMSKSAYLTDEGDHNMSHLMFYTRVKDGKDWGCGAPGSPVMCSPYWFFSPKEQPQMKGLPPILVSLVAVTNWSDGTPAGKHNE